MSNPFKPSNSSVNKPKRNAFDLSHTNHLTFDFGQLVPVLCEEVLPGDTFEISSALGLRFMPLAFPIQTKCKAYVHFFYQRTRNLWKDFEDFIYGNDKSSGRMLVPPYLAGSALPSMLHTCSLGDYLNLPTVRASSYFTGRNTDFMYYSTGNDKKLWTFPYVYRFPTWPSSVDDVAALNLSDAAMYEPDRIVADSETGEDKRLNAEVYGMFPFRFTLGTSGIYNFVVDVPKSNAVLNVSAPKYAIFPSTTNMQKPIALGECSVEDAVHDDNGTTFPVYRFRGVLDAGALFKSSENALFCLVLPVLSISTDRIYGQYYITESVMMDSVDTGSPNPFTGGKLKISALPFRCYESIYNAFYRDDRNNPLTDGVDSTPIYNEYLLNNNGGKDDTAYSLHNRNWEYDPYTSAVKSPQQGVAPLVGISSLGEVTFTYDGKDYTFGTETADDADTITKINVTEDVPNAVSRAIVNTVTSGISINDFRNVNAYQRWLETNIRRGLKYKDQTLARWGVTPADSTLDMPEFIGGYAVDVDINTVTNTNGDGSVPLGDYAAQATAFGGSNHKISHYCDQHGYIMAIVSVVPVPVYTQLFHKKFNRFSALDYYSPEFAQIGMQAIPYGEICPLEVDNPASNNNVEYMDVFGYQRPWHDYIYATDEAHGLFRTDFNQFLLSRTFVDAPTLNPDFLTVSPGALNDIFTVKNRNNILGMIRFNITAKRPIPRISLPSL